MPPFTNWPADSVGRLAQASHVLMLRHGSNVVTCGDRPDAVYLVVEGPVCVGFTASSGRSIVFTLHPPGERIHGIATLVDGREMPHDITAEGAVTVLAIPITAVRAELAHSPLLWESVALEVTARARAFIEEVRAALLEPLRPRLAGLLLLLAESFEPAEGEQSVTIGVHLPQERLGEMLGVSRQTATALVRELVRDGLVHWRYGRVTLLDLPRLRAIARERLTRDR